MSGLNPFMNADEHDTDAGDMRAVAVTTPKDDYLTLIEKLYKAASNAYIPSKFEDYRKIYDEETFASAAAKRPAQYPLLTIKGADDKPLVEMKPDSCILHQPFPTALLGEVKNCYESFQVSQCGSLSDAMALLKAMPEIKFTQKAFDSIEKNCDKENQSTQNNLNMLRAAIAAPPIKTQNTM